MIPPDIYLGEFETDAMRQASARAYITHCATTGTPVSLRRVCDLAGLTTGREADLLVRRTLAALADEGMRCREVRTVAHNERIGDGVRRAWVARRRRETA